MNFPIRFYTFDTKKKEKEKRKKRKDKELQRENPCVIKTNNKQHNILQHTSFSCRPEEARATRKEKNHQNKLYNL